ncbi:PEP-CTERM sorting domain-containing protein [Pseudoduganella chitinolytica]|uniref:PEP-CTERM sorting domain-containing protein n=1 Tax=Pseudoduganella chitinolytica TaxID=34070 RepID=A0ABY8BDY9_9BURK|nr:PEP-CTERM sorting domain-containing protein [Pseudoduganella chitinolytica]WEF33453.1 PEP-CTERM sorting domain-containing protein [Pseudoduganella chitinolytica]
MKQLLIGLVTAGAVCAAGGVQAATSVTATNLQIDMLYSDARFGMEVLSDNGGTLTLSMTNLMSPGLWQVTSEQWSGEYGNGDAASTSLQFDVRDGYRITALTISGKAYGVLDATSAPADVPAEWQPYARNTFDFRWYVNGATAGYRIGGSDIAGHQEFSDTVAQAIQGRSVVRFDTSLSVLARGYIDTPCTDHCWGVEYPATAGIQVSDVVMTVQIAPVPEPATYAMLLSGLALAGVVARRRKA